MTDQVDVVAASSETKGGGGGAADRASTDSSADETYKITMLERQIERLKLQNKQLTEEVGAKSNQITNLEQEKSALIRQLFQARSNVKLQPPAPQLQKGQNSGSDSTFMM